MTGVQTIGVQAIGVQAIGVQAIGVQAIGFQAIDFQAIDFQAIDFTCPAPIFCVNLTAPACLYELACPNLLTLTVLFQYLYPDSSSML